VQPLLDDEERRPYSPAVRGLQKPKIVTEQSGWRHQSCEEARLQINGAAC
jgi:hypothetical protein